MVSFHHLHRGLSGMANATRASSMAGHLGAAVVAGYFFGEDQPDLDPKIFTAIERDLDRIAGGEESIWFDPKKAGITAAQLFKPFPDEDERRDLIIQIAEALSRNIEKTRQSGHNVIFASIAIRALNGHARYATQQLIAGLEKLVASFDNAHPGRGYYGKERGWLNGADAPVADGTDIPAYNSLRHMAETVIDELIRTASEHRRGFGGLFHLVNHAAALTELSRFGYGELARKGFAAHRHHLLLYRALPDLTHELGQLEMAPDDPLQPDYWSKLNSKQWSAWLTHRIKTLYGFFTVLRYIENPAVRTNAEKQFRYLMA